MRVNKLRVLHGTSVGRCNESDSTQHMQHPMGITPTRVATFLDEKWWATCYRDPICRLKQN